MANPFVHVELNTTDVAKSKSFYTQLFDWQLKDETSPEMTYTMIGVGGGTGGGMMKQMMPGAPSAWLPYVDVADIRASTDKAKSLGAHILVDSQEVMGAGWITVFIDPTGAALGLWKAKKA